jgi:hypothetical protein
MCTRAVLKAGNTGLNADEAYEEYRAAIFGAVGDKYTYPLLDDLTGDDVVRRGLLTPSTGDKRRGGLQLLCRTFSGVRRGAFR